MKSISKIVNSIKKENWKYLLIGLQEKLNITQFELLDLFEIERTSKISYWINGKSEPLISYKLKILEYLLKNNFNIRKLIITGKMISKSIKFNGKWIFAKNALTTRDLNKNLIINKQGNTYLNIPKLFPYSRNNRIIYFIPYKKKFIIFYKEKRSTRPQPLILSKYLKLNKIFLVGLGIYLAEGSRDRRPKVTNSEPIIIKQAIKFFKLFNFNKKDFKVWIQLHERSNKSLKEVEDFWIKNTILSKRNIKKIRIKKSMGNAEIEPYGTSHLEVSYILFEILINNLINFVPLIIKELSKKQLVWFLQGAYAGEGYVGLAKSKSVNEISYTSKRKEERSLIKRILIRFGIKASESNKSGNLTTCGYYNLKKFYEIDIFKYHPYRRNRLQNGLIKLEKGHIPAFNKNKIINLLRKNSHMTSLEVSKFLNLSYECVKKHLRELEHSNKVNKINGSGSIPHRYFINRY